MARRSAQLGGGPSGALIKQEAIAQDQSAQRLQGANEGIDAAQNAENRRIREMEDARKFQTSERLGGQEFASAQREASQGFAAAQREQQNKFGAQQSNVEASRAEAMRLQQNIFGSEQAAIGRDESERQARIAQGIQSSQFSQTLDRDWQKFQHEMMVDDFNMKMANKMANEKDPLERLLSGDGINGGGWKGAALGTAVGGVPGLILGGGAGKKYKF
jgi:hypothetical protein